MSLSATNSLSLYRFLAIIKKEFVQMRRDRLTFAMLLGIPLMQLILFGFAINSDPKSLPTTVILNDHGHEARAFLWALENSGYFRIYKTATSEEDAAEDLSRGLVQFVVNIPSNFSHKLYRGEQATILIEADATDPAATSNAVGTLKILAKTAFARNFKGSLAYLGDVPGVDASYPVNLQIHALYNPEAVSQYNIVPGLMGVILTMTMVMITGLAITREKERGTMETLLAMPIRPIEVMIGKIVPYILIGYIQVCFILLVSYFLFKVPMLGNLALIFASAFIFIVANLAVGITFSSIARNQLQAMQMSFFFFLPSILLSGFMFPFRGMPTWAQFIGEILPLTHFLRIIRGVLLKGNTFWQIKSELLPISIFAIVILTIGIRRFRRTLD